MRSLTALYMLVQIYKPKEKHVNLKWEFQGYPYITKLEHSLSLIDLKMLSEVLKHAVERCSLVLRWIYSIGMVS